jgi:hypothetical protein
MFGGIPADKIRNRPVIEIPRPRPLLDKDGNIIFRDKRPQFDISSDRIDYEIGKQSTITVNFSERFIVGKERAKISELAALFYLANTTEWANVEVLVDGKNKPILNEAGNSQAVIARYGNRSASRTIEEITEAVELSYSAVHKALKAWESRKVMWKIETRRRPKTYRGEAGRPSELIRYEFDPLYVWNGFIWIRNGYSLFLQGPIEIVG